MKSYSDSYKAAGVDVTAGYKSVELMKEHVKRTSIPGVVSGIGGFGGLFQPDMTGMKEPVLVSGTCCSISMIPSALTALPCA